MSGQYAQSAGKQYTNITSRPVKTDESGKIISDGDRQSKKNKNRPGYGKKFKKSIVYIPPQP